MLFDDDSSHISFIPLTGDGSQGSPFQIDSTGLFLDGVSKSSFNTHLGTQISGTDYDFSSSSFSPNVVDVPANITAYQQVGGTVDISAGKYAMVPNEAGWSLIPVTLDPNTNNFEFTIGGSPIPGFAAGDFLMMVQPEFLLEEVLHLLQVWQCLICLTILVLIMRLCLIILELLEPLLVLRQKF